MKRDQNKAYAMRREIYQIHNLIQIKLIQNVP